MITPISEYVYNFLFLLAFFHFNPLFDEHVIGSAFSLTCLIILVYPGCNDMNIIEYVETAVVLPCFVMFLSWNSQILGTSDEVRDPNVKKEVKLVIRMMQLFPVKVVLA